MDGKAMYGKGEFTKDFYTIGEVSEYTGKSVKALQGCDRRGLLAFERTPTNRRVLGRESLVEYLDRLGRLSEPVGDGRCHAIYVVEDGDEWDKVALLVHEVGEFKASPLIVSDPCTASDGDRPNLGRLASFIGRGLVSDVWMTAADADTMPWLVHVETIASYLGVTFHRVGDGQVGVVPPPPPQSLPPAVRGLK